MKRAVIVLLLLIANALVSANKDRPSDETPRETKVAQASSLQYSAAGKLEACATL